MYVEAYRDSLSASDCRYRDRNDGFLWVPNVQGEMIVALCLMTRIMRIPPQ